jgi:polyphenol oxidase
VVSVADRGRGTLATGDAVGPADALVTATPGTVLAILVADCVPIILYDPAAHVLACVHAGWRGTVARTAQAALAAMCSLGTRPPDVIAGIGPSVAAGSYQVGEEVAGAAREAFGQQAQALLRPAATGGPGQWLFDLPAANRHVLRTAGVPDGQIHVAATPTGPGPGLFFSHRAERPCGRFALAARLEPREQR